MIDPLHGIEGKKWLSKGERAAIKALKPYKGGDHTIWSLHQLDILRKHERLVSTRPDVMRFSYEAVRPEKDTCLSAAGEELRPWKTKFILAGMRPISQSLDAPGHAHVAAHVTFDEAEIGITDEEVTTTLMRFAERVTEIVKLFDVP